MLSQYHVTADLIFREMMQGNIAILSGDTSIPAATAVNFHIKSSHQPLIIFNASVNASGAELLIQGFSDATVSADGTPYSVVCTNRIVGTTHGIKAYQAPTVTDDGDEVIHLVAYAETQGQRTSLAGIQDGLEYLLNPNASHLFRMTNRDATNACKVSFKVAMIEADL